ncbi:hypothetical protein [Clostridium botulinum]|uniref:Uncharacterized protein n=1 Tax=Clostridium botulinum TaxID=1491 RepID=A0A9Q1UWN1_CLOBO|nr:hypothetical protein [Clostridium botulinum]KEI04279.1 hypothetical protein Y848_02415 [Clostridium botulinum C/D str. Sp77]KLU75779.1 hypothetical protein CBC3_06655 [Clostridium botulinum V891]KOA73138.1 hypothetical protein ADU78_13250 [Clostridium botulinum]KOA74987.1 hypothetical protein ADU77_11290 [Clostridium botulinum]KOA84848.1 hypothetical protein ADU74_10685 [Clostridium botulinum]
MINFCCLLNERIKYICNCEYNYFLNKPSVLGVGLGYKFINGINTQEPCIHVLVTKKLPINDLPSSALIPPLYKNTKTDIIEVGDIIAGQSNSFSNSPLIKKIRPIQPGYGMSTVPTSSPWQSKNTGTFGYIVTDNKQASKGYCLLSTMTTFTNSNDTPIATKIVQPSRQYGGTTNDVVAKLLRFIPIKFISGSKEPVNYVDSAVASYFNMGEIQLINPFIPNIGIPQGITTPKVGKLVQWTGCITGHHIHNITTINATLKIPYQPNLRKALFKDVFVIKGNINGDYDDKGALIVTKKNVVVGLLFAGAEETVVGCGINHIMNELDIRLLRYDV